MPPPKFPISTEPAVQALAAAALYASRTLADITSPDSDTLPDTRRLIARVTPEAMREFAARPDVIHGAKGALAAGSSFAVTHGIENLVAGTDALRRLGASIIDRHPSIARIFTRNPNAALVAGTVAFPYVASPFFEQWFKAMLGYDTSRDAARAPADWKVGFMATVANWNHVQPGIAAVLRHHPAVLALAGPLATGLTSAGVDVLKTLDTQRDALGAAADANPNTGETAVGKAIASQTRYFVDALRQSLKRHAHVTGLATQFLTSNLYPGWVAAMSNLYAADLAHRLHASNDARAADASSTRVATGALNTDALDLDIVSMIEAPDGRRLLEHLEARPTMFAQDASNKAVDSAPQAPPRA